MKPAPLSSIGATKGVSVKLHEMGWAILAVFVAAGCVAIFAGLVRNLRNAIVQRQRDTDRQLQSLSTTVKALQARVAELSSLQREQTHQAEAAAAATAASDSKRTPKSETLVALAAAATAFLGKKARIRSVQALPSDQDSAGAWAQQGRVIVQTSHNPRPRG